MSVQLSRGTHPLEYYEIVVNGETVKSGNPGADGGTITATIKLKQDTSNTIVVNVRDSAQYTGTASRTIVQ